MINIYKDSKDINLLKNYSNINDVDLWYCSELVYASYVNTGITLCYAFDYVMPRDILDASSCTFGPLNVFLDLKFGGNKVSNKWPIYVYNCTNEPLTVYYNTKMCFENDTKYCTNLNNVSTYYLPSNSYVKLNISTNLFATCCTFSVIKNNVRYITYCKNLNQLGMTILKTKN